jgi:hypothetical protein
MLFLRSEISQCNAREKRGSTGEAWSPFSCSLEDRSQSQGRGRAFERSASAADGIAVRTRILVIRYDPYHHSVRERTGFYGRGLNMLVGEDL